MERKTIKYKGAHVFEKVSVPNMFNRIPKEFEGHEACFIFIEDGSLSVRTPDEIQHYKKGDTMLAKCFDFFFELKPEDKKVPGTIDMVGVILNKEIVEELFAFDLSAYNYQVDFNVAQSKIDALLESFKQSILILLDNPELADDLIVATKIKEFVLLLSKKHNAPSEQDFLAGLLTSPTFDFKQTVLNNLYATLSMNEFALLCSMSVSTFKRRFSEVFGESPKHFINKKKVQKAESLLSSTTLRIAEIAYDTGFDSLSSFNRNFKQEYGKSPSDYRFS